MSKLNTLLALLLVAVLGAVLAVPANAASSSGRAIINDCSTSDTGMLKGSYSKGDLRSAQKLVRGDVAEYTGCYDAIKAALRPRPRTNDDANTGGGNGGDTSGGGGGGFDSGTGGTSGGGTTGSSSSSSDGGTAGTTGGGTTGADGTADGSTAAPTTPAPTAQQPGTPAAPVQLAGATITPGFGATADPGGRALPTPLIAFLVLLAAGAVGIAAPTIGRRVLARRRG